MVRELKPATMIMMVVLLAMIFVPAFFLAKPVEQTPPPDELTTPPDINFGPPTNRPAPKANPPQQNSAQPNAEGHNAPAVE
jgi:hypothetical protein